MSTEPLCSPRLDLPLQRLARLIKVLMEFCDSFGEAVLAGIESTFTQMQGNPQNDKEDKEYSNYSIVKSIQSV